MCDEMCILTFKMVKDKVFVHRSPKADVKRSFPGCTGGGWLDLLLIRSLVSYTCALGIADTIFLGAPPPPNMYSDWDKFVDLFAGLMSVAEPDMSCLLQILVVP